MTSLVTISECIFRYDEPSGVEDNLEAVLRDDGVTITIEEPWSGDTESGFGYSTSIRMGKQVAASFARWLAQWASDDD